MRAAAACGVRRADFSRILQAPLHGVLDRPGPRLRLAAPRPVLPQVLVQGHPEGPSLATAPSFDLHIVTNAMDLITQMDHLGMGD